jgi:alkanesulfonate monooxygenase SsuD/methylene tetrahydromethanopterin reductase-like flavin-dependent oxidoreductase (luciferase family)
MSDYLATRKKHGLPSEGIEYPLFREAYCADSDEQAWAESREGVLAVYKEYLDWGHMLDDDGNPVSAGDDSALELLRKRFIIGSPETCIREARRCVDELRTTNMVLRMKFPGISHERVMKSIRLWGEKVMPALG